MFKHLERFHQLLPVTAPDSLEDLDSRLRIYGDDVLEIWYAPMESPPPNASVWILGITPGWRQMRLAYEAAAEALQGGASPREAATCRKPRVAFAGSMRNNLVTMLDELEVAALLEVPSVALLFGTSRLRTGSAMRYPVFQRGRNYTGHSPKPTKHAALKEMMEVVLWDELRGSGSELIVPLGKAVEEALRYAATRGQVDEERVLYGFPHPSGANGHRVRHFAENKNRLRRALRIWHAAVA